MKLFAFGTAALLLASVTPVYAQTPEEICFAKYPIPDKEINSVAELTGHDPLVFQLRRCITLERKAQQNAVRAARIQSRMDTKASRVSEKGKELLRTSEEYLNKTIRKSLMKDSRARGRMLDSAAYIKARQTERASRRVYDGTGRITEIRQKLRERNLADPCETVRVMTKVNPCERN